VRFLTLLALFSFLYSLGAYSLLHGLLYTLIPSLWLAREAGRIVYLVDFALAALAAFGAHQLFSESVHTINWNIILRFCRWTVITTGAICLGAAVFGRPEISPWIQLSLLLMLLAYALFSRITHGNMSRSVRFLTVALVVFDLSAFDWSAANKRVTAQKGTNYFDRLYSCRRAVDFLKAQRGPFRVEVAAEPPPNIGNFFGVETTFGAGATIPNDYLSILGRRDLLNVRYLLTEASANEPGTIVWSDGNWQIRELSNQSPRAWLVHTAAAESSPGSWRAMLAEPGFAPSRTAIVDTPVSLEAAVPDAKETVVFSRSDSDHIRVQAHAFSRALLVLSETYYPGWRVSVNGSPARIHKTDGALRGIVVPKGKSEVLLRYMPSSVFAGGALSIGAFGTVLAAWIIIIRSRRVDRALTI